LVELAGATVEVGLRTAVWFPSKESVKGKDDLIADMNEIIRDVSIQVNCSLYDYDRDVWSLFDFQHTSESNHNKIFREKGSVDPIARYSASAAEKMLGRQNWAAYWGRGAAAGLYAVNTSSSEVFGQGSLIRFHLDKQVYRVEGFWKRPISSAQTMLAIGWDFDQVQVLSASKYLDLLPTGPPL